MMHFLMLLMLLYFLRLIYTEFGKIILTTFKLNYLAATYFTSTMANQAPDAVDARLCVIHAALIKMTQYHMLYNSLVQR
jgi:hypothetical protein